MGAQHCPPYVWVRIVAMANIALHTGCPFPITPRRSSTLASIVGFPIDPGVIVGFPIDPHVRGVSESEIIKVKAHYNWSMYQAVLNATRRSLNVIKYRLAVKRSPPNQSPYEMLDRLIAAGKQGMIVSEDDRGDGGENGGEGGGSNMMSPFFEVEVQLDGVGVSLRPSRVVEIHCFFHLVLVQRSVGGIIFCIFLYP